MVARQQDLPRVIDKAKNRGVGVVVMKTLMGARLNDMRPYERDGATFSQAAFRWVLLKPQRRSAYRLDYHPRLDREFLGSTVPRTPSTRVRRARVGVGLGMRTRMCAVDYGDMGMARDDHATSRPSSSVPDLYGHACTVHVRTGSRSMR
jgi:hypothetical protein